MANIRKKVYRKKDGTSVEKFELTYSDQRGGRTTKLFKTKRDADAERIRIENEVASRTHVSARTSRTVIDGLRAWIKYMERLVDNGKRERSTIAKYKSHVEFHISKSNLANLILSEVTQSDMQTFVEHLEINLSTVMARKVFMSLKIGLKYCRKQQWIRTLPTEDFKIENRDRESSGKIVVPTKEEIKALLRAADEDITGIDAAIIRVLAHCGLRPSELRGLTRQNVMADTKPAKIKISQRADVYNILGNPKSRAGYREIPIGPETLRCLKKAMLSRKAGIHKLVFPDTEGDIWAYSNFVHTWWPKIMLRAGLATTQTIRYASAPEDKRIKITPNFHPYALRHVAASNWIEMGLMPKRIQELMGHSSLKLTMDTYGHLWANPEVDNQIAMNTEQAFA